MGPCGMRTDQIAGEVDCGTNLVTFWGYQISAQQIRQVGDVMVHGTCRTFKKYHDYFV